MVDEGQVLLGNATLLKEADVKSSLLANEAECLRGEGQAVMFCAADGQLGSPRCRPPVTAIDCRSDSPTEGRPHADRDVYQLQLHECASPDGPIRPG